MFDKLNEKIIIVINIYINNDKNDNNNNIT